MIGKNLINVKRVNVKLGVSSSPITKTEEEKVLGDSAASHPKYFIREDEKEDHLFVAERYGDGKFEICLVLKDIKGKVHLQIAYTLHDKVKKKIFLYTHKGVLIGECGIKSNCAFCFKIKIHYTFSDCRGEEIITFSGSISWKKPNVQLNFKSVSSGSVLGSMNFRDSSSCTLQFNDEIDKERGPDEMKLLLFGIAVGLVDYFKNEHGSESRK